jgi:hypothetical protein
MLYIDVGYWEIGLMSPAMRMLYNDALHVDDHSPLT